MNFEPSGFFVLRTPLLSFDEFLSWSAGLEAPASLNNPTRFEQAIADDRRSLRARLTAIASRPEMREALFVASPHLEESLQIWAREPESERGKGIELAIARYFVRMAARPNEIKSAAVGASECKLQSKCFHKVARDTTPEQPSDASSS